MDEGMSTAEPKQKLNDILRQAWQAPFSTKSDFARANANLVALAASQGLISTRVGRETYGTKWLLAPAGLERICRFKPAAA